MPSLLLEALHGLYITALDHDVNHCTKTGMLVQVPSWSAAVQITAPIQCALLSGLFVNAAILLPDSESRTLSNPQVTACLQDCHEHESRPGYSQGFCDLWQAVAKL